MSFEFFPISLSMDDRNNKKMPWSTGKKCILFLTEIGDIQTVEFKVDSSYSGKMPVKKFSLNVSDDETIINMSADGVKIGLLKSENTDFFTRFELDTNRRVLKILRLGQPAQRRPQPQATSQPTASIAGIRSSGQVRQNGGVPPVPPPPPPKPQPQPPKPQPQPQLQSNSHQGLPMHQSHMSPPLAPTAPRASANTNSNSGSKTNGHGQFKSPVSAAPAPASARPSGVMIHSLRHPSDLTTKSMQTGSSTYQETMRQLAPSSGSNSGSSSGFSGGGARDSEGRPRTFAPRPIIIHPTLPKVAASTFFDSNKKYHHAQRPSAGLGAAKMEGMRNLGNTCYMGAVTQAVFAQEGFSRDLQTPFWTAPFADEGASADALHREKSCITQLSALARAKAANATQGGGKTLDLSGLKRAIAHHSRTFSGNDQQDAQEFLCALLDRVHDECAERVKHVASFLPEEVAASASLASTSASGGGGAGSGAGAGWGVQSVSSGLTDKSSSTAGTGASTISASPAAAAVMQDWLSPRSFSSQQQHQPGTGAGAGAGATSLDGAASSFSSSSTPSVDQSFRHQQQQQHNGGHEVHVGAKRAADEAFAASDFGDNASINSGLTSNGGSSSSSSSSGSDSKRSRMGAGNGSSSNDGYVGMSPLSATPGSALREDMMDLTADDDVDSVALSLATTAAGAQTLASPVSLLKSLAALMPSMRHFHAEVAVHFSCTSCGHRCEPKCDFYRDFSLEMGRPEVAKAMAENREVPIMSLLRAFLAVEVRDLACEGCSNKKAQARVTSLLSKLPGVLVLHLKRFRYVPATNSFCKVAARVSFPAVLELSKDMLSDAPEGPDFSLSADLDSTPQALVNSWLERQAASATTPLRSPPALASGVWACSACTLENDKSETKCGACGEAGGIPTPGDKRHWRYRLTSVVRHMGPGAFAGHYTCDVANPPSAGGGWSHCNDSLVSPTTLERVLEQKDSPYLLFYSLMPPDV